MKASIQTVFGRDTMHRCCLWHVMKKARDHLGVLYGSVKGFREELGAVIDLSWTIVDFETNWLAMLKKYKMEKNSYLTLMFDKRDEWAPAYFCEVFCAGMSTTQRSESMNAVIKIWMGSNTSLYDFATKFEKMVESVYERESDEDIKTMNETPQLWSCHPIEAEARKVYTRKIFSLFRDNWKRSTALDVHEVQKGKLYEVSHVTKQSKYEWYKSNHMVLIDQINGRTDCECKGFLNEGLLCSHALEVMRQVKMRPFLPPHYILKRWTRDANASTKRGVNEHELECKDLQSVMRNALTKRLDIIVNKGCKSRASYDIACTILDELDERLTGTNEEIAEVGLSTNLNASAEENIKDSLTFRDPLVSQCKGKRKPHRFKSPVEIKSAKKMRTCSICHKKEGHNMRKCPMRKKDGQARGTVSHNYEEDSEFESENDVL